MSLRAMLREAYVMRYTRVESADTRNTISARYRATLRVLRRHADAPPPFFAACHYDAAMPLLPLMRRYAITNSAYAMPPRLRRRFIAACLMRYAIRLRCCCFAADALRHAMPLLMLTRHDAAYIAEIYAFAPCLPLCYATSATFFALLFRYAAAI